MSCSVSHEVSELDFCVHWEKIKISVTEPSVNFDVFLPEL